jgi:hypothetical protein
LVQQLDTRLSNQINIQDDIAGIVCVLNEALSPQLYEFFFPPVFPVNIQIYLLLGVVSAETKFEEEFWVVLK